MNQRKLTTEQLLAIDRWENEGGKISISRGVVRPARPVEPQHTDEAALYDGGGQGGQRMFHWPNLIKHF